jgi:putative ABC transport system substrate-binding protein
MRRREFVTLLGGAAAGWPLAARGQQPDKPHRIGFLGLGLPSASASRLEGLRQGLRERGYSEGKDIVIDFRWAETVDRLNEGAIELARNKTEVIFVISSTETEAARQATKTIPIVFGSRADPVGVGHVASLARPGGNVTGLTAVQTDLTAKAIEILKETVPQATRFGILSSPTAPSHRPTLEAAGAAAQGLGLALHVVAVQSSDEFETAFAEFKVEAVQAVFVSSSSVTIRANPALLARVALKHGLPTMFGAKDNVVAGGLMSYAPDANDLWRQAATYIDKILKGAKPADLPVEQASKYQLVINLKTARALGLTVPPTLLARADEVIE